MAENPEYTCLQEGDIYYLKNIEYTEIILKLKTKTYIY